MRSATARTSSMLWLMMMTPRPRSRTRSIRFSTSAVCATPRAAVGSSSMMISRVEQQRAGDGDGLALAARQRGDGLADRRDAGGEFVQQRPGADLHRHLVEPPGVELVAEKEVRDHVEVLAQREVLKDRGDPQLQRRRAGVSIVTGLAHEFDGARGRLMHAGQHLDQRRLAGAVVADQRHHLARVDVEFDVGQRRDRAEVLARCRARLTGCSSPFAGSRSRCLS